MICHSIDCSTAKRYHVVCNCKYFVVNTLSGTKTQDFKPLFSMGVPTGMNLIPVSKSSLGLMFLLLCVATINTLRLHFPNNILRLQF